MKQSKGKLMCKTCKRIEVLFSQPLKTRLHDYDLNTTLDNIDNINKVDSYFYHDLTRFTVELIDDLLNTSWPQTITFPKCGKHMDKEQKEERMSYHLAQHLSSELFYGMFGRFVFNSPKIGNNYQEISVRTNKVIISGDKPNRNTKICEWEYEGHTGTLIFPQALHEGPGTDGLPHYEIVTIIVCKFYFE